MSLYTLFHDSPRHASQRVRSRHPRPQQWIRISTRTMASIVIFERAVYRARDIGVAFGFLSRARAFDARARTLRLSRLSLRVLICRSSRRRARAGASLQRRIVCLGLGIVVIVTDDGVRARSPESSPVAFQCNLNRSYASALLLAEPAVTLVSNLTKETRAESIARRRRRRRRRRARRRRHGRRRSVRH